MRADRGAAPDAPTAPSGAGPRTSTGTAVGSVQRHRLPRAERRAQLLAAADRVLTRDGPGASMQAIATEAGITKPILYRNFGDRDGLLRALAEQHTEGLLDELRATLTGPGDLRARTAAAVDAYLRLIEGRPAVYRFLTRGAAGEPDVSGTVDLFARRLGDELAGGMLHEPELAGLDAGRATSWGHAIVGLVRAAADVWLERRHVSREALGDQLVDLLWGRLPVR